MGVCPRMVMNACILQDESGDAYVVFLLPSLTGSSSMMRHTRSNRPLSSLSLASTLLPAEAVTNSAHRK